MAKTEITAERVRELFHYNPETGFLWRRYSNASRRVETLDSKGYVQVGVDYANCRGHRVIWLWVYGEWPKQEIDHINGIRSDNRLANLRVVNASTNQQNRTRPASHNTSGFLGVHYEEKRDRWKAVLTVRGRTKNLGRYATPEEAHDAYLEAKRRLHEGCTI